MRTNRDAISRASSAKAAGASTQDAPEISGEWRVVEAETQKRTRPSQLTASDYPTAVALFPAPLELIVLVREQDIETRQRSVTSRRISLQPNFRIVGQIRRVDLLFERAQAISQHDDLVKERFNRPLLFLQARRAGTQRHRAAAPLFGGDDGADAGLLANDASQQQLEIGGRTGYGHGWRAPFASADEIERRAGRFRAPVRQLAGG